MTLSHECLIVLHFKLEIIFEQTFDNEMRLLTHAISIIFTINYLDTFVIFDKI